MHGLFLILKNSLRNSFRNRFQLIGLTLLVSLLALILSLMASINSRVIESYNFLKSESNARNVVLQMDPFDQVETGDTPNSPAPKNLIEAQQYWLYELQQQYYREDNNLQFEWSRTEAREFSQVSHQNNKLTLKTIAKITPKNVFNQNPVDSLVIFEGHDIRSDRQVVIDPIYAKDHKIKIGDIIRIQQDYFGDQLLVKSSKNENITEKLRSDVKEMEQKGLDDSIGVYQREYVNNYDWYQVVGFGGSADFMMPILNSSSVLPNRNTELLVYVHPTAFGLELAEGNNGSKKGLYVYNRNSSDGQRLTVSSNNEWESFYSLVMGNHRPTKGDIQKLNRDFNQILKKNVDAKTYFYGANDPGYRYALRTLAIDRTIAAYNIGSSILEILFAVIVLYSIGLVTRKQIEKIQGQIGTLKALGYYKRQLVFNFVMTPFFASFIGGIVGFAIAGGLSGVIINTFADYFLLNYGVAKFNWLVFIGVILLLWLVLTGITFLIAFLVFRKETTTLINARQTSKASKFGSSYREKRSNKNIGSKISSALLADATGKMSVVGIVVLIATMVFTMSFAAPDILRRNQTASYSGVKYKQIVEYSDPVYNNPMSFYKTYNIEAKIDTTDPDDIFKYSKELNGYTSLPILLDENGKYNVNRIMSDYAKNNINNEFFSLFLKNGGTEEDPRPDLVTTNLRYLFGKDIASSTDYYRFISSFGDKGNGFFDKILLNQWPDYNELMSNLSDANKSLVDIFDILQTFYAKYVNSIGLSITNDYYAEDIKPGDDDDQKIESFNSLTEPGNRSDPQKILETTKTDQGDNFNSELKNLTIDNDSFKFNFTDSSYKLGAFHITDGINNDKDEVNDYFLSLRGRDLSPEDLKDNLIKFIIWFGSLFSNRGDQGIIQAAYFRPPYFVQQFFKQAYFNKTPYVQGFGVVSYNPEVEQIGTRLEVKSQKNNKFKIYGVEKSSSRFLNLKNKKSQNLIDDLYNSEEKNGIVINKSVAKILNLKSGDEVNLKVLQDELREKNPDNKDDVQAVDLNSWTVEAPRKNEELKTGFTQLNNLGKSDLIGTPGINTKLQSKFGNNPSWATTGSSLQPNNPSPLYNQVLEGNLLNEQLETNVNFKVIGIHDGYGSPQAWIKEDEAQQILQFDKIKKFAWDNWFVYQWGNEFTTAHADLETGFDFKGISDLDFSNEEKISYEDFINKYVNSSNSTVRKAAQIVLDIFNNSFPIFNYKYSNKDDVGDLKSLVAIHQRFGDYSPIGMQGINANGRDIKKSYEGVGQGAIGTIVPVAISKAILKKISDLVLLILILAIIAILLVTFVIIFLTTSLIIDDNIKFIATMKVLGYSNRYIASKVLGMYFIVIGSVFVIGFVAGWFIFTVIVHALIPTIVLPLQFQIWLPFLVLMGVVGIYLITISVGFNSIARTNAVNILQNNDL